MDENKRLAPFAKALTDLALLTDTHCHVDQFESPEALVQQCLKDGLEVVAVTNLPSHYEIALRHLNGVAHIHPALGLHPLVVEKNAVELDRFLQLAPAADFIGEVGMDFSYEGRRSRAAQETTFNRILSALIDRQRFVTIHSRGAEKEVLATLSHAGLRKAVFHWYSGPLNLVDDILSAGHYFSLNPAMLTSRAFPQFLSLVPTDRVLLESDGPHAKIGTDAAKPRDILRVFDHLHSTWGVSPEALAVLLANNFQEVLARSS